MPILDLLLSASAVIAGFVALVWGADRFVLGAAATARNLGVSPLVIGLTIVGFGTSAPELLVSGVAAAAGSAGLCVGNALGSNITNIALVLGAAAVVNPLIVHRQIIRRDLPVLLSVMVCVVALLWDRDLGRLDGSLLIGGLAVMIVLVARQGLAQRSADAPKQENLADEVPEDMPLGLGVLWMAVGLGVLLASARLLVWGAVSGARALHVHELTIGLTVVAFGTSLPELAASVIAARRGEHDIAVGNVVGSNMFNLLGVLGLPGLIAPGGFPEVALWRDMPVMFVFTLGFLAVAAISGRHRVGRFPGSIMIALYLGYVTHLYALHTNTGHANADRANAGHARADQPSASARQPQDRTSATAPKPNPPAPEQNTPAKSTPLAVGAAFGCAIRAHDVACWGHNHFGQLGDPPEARGAFAHRARAEKVTEARDAVSISAGRWHVCALTRDRTIQCWGHGGFGQLGQGKTRDESKPISVRQPSGGHNARLDKVVQVVCGGDHTCAVRERGDVWCWGRNHRGQLGTGDQNNRSLPAHVPLDGKVEEIALGREHSCARSTDGITRCWGSTIDGQLGRDAGGPLVSRPSQISDQPARRVFAGGYQTCLDQGSKLRCWGRSDAVRLGPSRILVDLALGAHHACAIHKPGTVLCSGLRMKRSKKLAPEETRQPLPVPNIRDATHVAGGARHACVLRQSGVVTCWGNNRYGQLGADSAADPPVLRSDVAGIARPSATL